MKPRILFALLLPCIPLLAESTPSKSLLVLSKSDNTLGIVDPSTWKVIARMPSGQDPHEVAASSDGKFAYISNYGGGSLNTITVVDLIAQKTLEPIDLGPLRGPHGLMFVGGKLWFTAEGAKVVASYDPTTKKVDWVLGTGQNRTHMIYVFDDLKRMLTTNVSSATMTVIEKTTVGGPGGPGGPPPPGADQKKKGAPGRGPGGPREDWNETVITVGRGAEGFDVTPDGKQAWAANAQDGTISILDLGTKQVVKTLDANVSGANRLKFSPDGKLALVSTLRGEDLTVFNVAGRNEVKRLKIGTGAAGIQMQPDGARAFIACTPDGYVVILDLKTLEIAGKIDAGKQPDGMAWAVRP